MTNEDQETNQKPVTLTLDHDEQMLLAHLLSGWKKSVSDLVNDAEYEDAVDELHLIMTMRVMFNNQDAVEVIDNA